MIFSPCFFFNQKMMNEIERSWEKDAFSFPPFCWWCYWQSLFFSLNVPTDKDIKFSFQSRIDRKKSLLIFFSIFTHFVFMFLISHIYLQLDFQMNCVVFQEVFFFQGSSFVTEKKDLIKLVTKSAKLKTFCSWFFFLKKLSASYSLLPEDGFVWNVTNNGWLFSQIKSL